LKLLITGGAGFIGSNFIHYLWKTYPDYEIVNVDALTYAGNLDNLENKGINGAKSQNYRFLKADISDIAAMKRLFAEEKFDAVINFAAESHVDRSIMEPDIFVRSNIIGTQTLLEMTRTNPIQKFVQISTDEVYGSLGDEGLFTEETPLAPNSPYSASKAGADLLVRAYHETYGIPVNITRCSNNYGPYQFPEKLIPLMISRALANEPLPVYGDGLNVRDWLYVEDHCHAIDLVLHQGRNGEVYNIGGHNEHTNLQVVRTILRELGKPESLITFVEDRLGHDRRYAIDASKIRRELGWEPKHEFEVRMRDTIQWYLQHGEWLSRIASGEYRQNNMEE